MMKLFILFLITSLSTQLVQANNGQWELISEISEKAVTPYGVKTMLNNWEYKSLFQIEKDYALSSLLVGEQINPIDSIEVTTSQYKWTGDTVCPANDPRLFYKSYGSMICYTDINSPEGFKGCSGVEELIWPRDPCEVIAMPFALHEPQYKRTKLN